MYKMRDTRPGSMFCRIQTCFVCCIAPCFIVCSVVHTPSSNAFVKKSEHFFSSFRFLFCRRTEVAAKSSENLRLVFASMCSSFFLQVLLMIMRVMLAVFFFSFHQAAFLCRILSASLNYKKSKLLVSLTTSIAED